MKLSPIQVQVIEALKEYGAVAWGFAPLPTMRKLEALGLIRWYPYSSAISPRGGAWKLSR